MKTYLPLVLIVVALSAAEKPATSEAKSPEAKVADPKAALAQQLKEAGIKSAAVEVAGMQKEVVLSGQVVDPLPLVNSFQEWVGAKISAETAEQELGRMEKLRANNEVSARLFRTTEAEALKARLATSIAYQKLLLNVGPDLLRQGRLENLLNSISSGESALVRLDLPLGLALDERPAAKIAAVFNPAQSQSGACVSYAPAVSPLTQGPALFYLVEKPQPALKPGAAVSATLPISKPATPAFVPEAALLRANGRTFVYRETGEVSPHHVRCPLQLLQRATLHDVDGWLVTGGIKAGDKIVVQGAFTLLSWETLEDEAGAEAELEKPESQATPPAKTK